MVAGARDLSHLTTKLELNGDRRNRYIFSPVVRSLSHPLPSSDCWLYIVKTRSHSHALLPLPLTATLLPLVVLSDWLVVVSVVFLSHHGVDRFQDERRLPRGSRSSLLVGSATAADH